MRRLNRWRTVLALAVPAVLLIAVLYDKWRSDTLLPPFLRFVPPNADVFAATDRLSELVEISAFHAELLWGWGADIEPHCVGFQQASELARHGIDGSRGAAAFQTLSSNIVPRATVVALPIADKERAVNFVRSLAAPSARLTLTAEQSTKTVQQFRIENPEIEGMRLCTDTSPVPVELKSGLLVLARPLPTDATAGNTGADAQFFAVRETDGPASLKLQCTAIYEDGSEGACSCSLDGAPCNGPVPGAFPDAIQLDGPTDTPILQMGKGVFYIETLPEVGLIAFLEPNLDVAPSDGDPPEPEYELGPLLEAIETDRNLASFRNDDTYIRMVSEFRQTRRDGDVSILASARSRLPAVMGTTHIEASILPSSMNFTMFAPLETGGARIVEHLAAPAPGPNPKRINSLTAGNLTFLDSQASAYFDYTKTYFSDIYSSATSRFGDLAAVIDNLAEAHFSKIDVDLYGEKDGVGGLVIRIDMRSEDIDKYFAATAVQLQRSRDLKLLKAAFKRAAEKGNVRETTTTADLASYLPEDRSILDDYTLSVAMETEHGQPEPSFDGSPSLGEPEPVSFSVGASYEKAVFLSPPVTGGDLDYRFTKDASGEAEDGSDSDMPDLEIDDKGLREGRYRVIGLSAGDQIVIVSNRDTLQQFLSASEEVAEAPPGPGEKLRLEVEPERLRNELALHPDPAIRKLAETHLRSIASYRRLQALVEPDQKLDGLRATILLDYDE